MATDKKKIFFVIFVKSCLKKARSKFKAMFYRIKNTHN